VLSGVPLQADGLLAVDVLPVRVQGPITLDGAPLPDAREDRGALLFRLERGGTLRTDPLEDEGARTYALTLLAGSYDVAWDGNEALCQETPAPPVPCNDGPLLEGLPLNADGELAVDVQAVRVQGAVTLNGARLPDDDGERGALAFVLPSSASELRTRPLGSRGAARYDVALLPGHYDVRWEGTQPRCAEEEATVAPCNGGKLLDAVPLTLSGVLDVDVPAVTVQGSVTLEGARLPDELSSRGNLAWSLVSQGRTAADGLLSRGARRYELTLLAGDYLVWLQANPGLCEHDASRPQVPCIDGVLAGCP